MKLFGTFLSLFVLVALSQSAEAAVKVTEIDTPEYIQESVDENYSIGREEGDFGGVDMVQAFKISGATKKDLFYVLRQVIEGNHKLTSDKDKLDEILENSGKNVYGPFTALEWCALQADNKDFDKLSQYRGKKPSRLNAQCANYILNKKLLKKGDAKKWLLSDLARYDYDENFVYHVSGIQKYLKKQLGRGYMQVVMDAAPWPSVDGELVILISKDLKKAFVTRADEGA